MKKPAEQVTTEELRSIKFLELVKILALNQKDLAVPYGREDLWQTQMFTLGVVEALSSRGYKIQKDGQ